MAEKHVHGGQVGELIYTILVDQFTRLRDGDRFWYQAYLPQSLVLQLEKQTLCNIIQRNTSIRHEMQADVFRVPPDNSNSGHFDRR